MVEWYILRRCNTSMNVPRPVSSEGDDKADCWWSVVANWSTYQAVWQRGQKRPAYNLGHKVAARVVDDMGNDGTQTCAHICMYMGNDRQICGQDRDSGGLEIVHDVGCWWGMRLWR